MPTTALIVAAGAGLRMGLGTPKAFLSIAGRSLMELSLAAFDSHPGIDGIILIAPADRLEEARRIAAGFRKVKDVVAGGPRRQDSVRLGLESLRGMIDDGRAGDPLVLVHDAARPLVDASLIAAVIDSTARVGAAIPGLAPSDMVRQTSNGGGPPGHTRAGSVLDRRSLVLVQTPQGFRLPLLLDAYASAADEEVTDDAALVQRLGHPVEVVPGSPFNMKITTPGDLEIAAAILAARNGS
ncbi:MAG TPA: 2-C-methyl-D-erythritol 4-phosphate cytidylyltransferase [Patescibacteria group bacterium]|nr:2-C-methyl-D-erythritol 4-phosphate cytidylyltransferase [Patescibacteria group bacterium]